MSNEDFIPASLLFKNFYTAPSIPANEVTVMLEQKLIFADDKGKFWRFVILHDTNYDIFVVDQDAFSDIESAVGKVKINLVKTKAQEKWVYMLDIFVKEEFRRRGIGGKLDDLVAEIGKLNGASRIFGSESAYSDDTPFFYDSQKYDHEIISGNMAVIRTL